MDINIHSIPIYTDDIKVRKESFGMLLVSKRTPILTLNDDSTAIWCKINGIDDIKTIISKLRKEYNCSSSELEDTVITFLDNCNKLGLIIFR